ncbi:hypothetical protein GCM10010340_70670 [Streptomyces griseoloalbus]|nr:hypothetical protein GCM10010340_70670 [Streptomyces albaduncus]
MKSRATVPAPTLPDCAECTRLRTAERTAENEGDQSRAIDCRVLLRRHLAAAHRIVL